MMKQERRTLAKKITLGLVIGAVMASGSLAYAEDKTGSTTIDNGTTVSVAGYEATGNDNVKNSTLTVTGGTIWTGTELYGGKAENGSATGNTVSISGGNFGMGIIYGGSSKNGVVENNTVEIGGNVADSSYFMLVCGGESTTGNVSNNRVTINKGMIYGVNGGHSTSTGDVVGNIVTINGGTSDIGAYVYGGNAQYMGAATSNEVIINDGAWNNANITGGLGVSARGNKVTIGSAENSKITTDDVFKNIHGGTTNAHGGEANGNSITIYNGRFVGHIAGGYADQKENPSMNNNTVSLYDGDFSSANVYGGLNGGTTVYGGKDNPNTLNFGTSTKGYTGAVKSIAGFDVIHFNSVDWQKDSTVISANSLALNPNDGGTAITVGSINIVQGGMLNQDDSMTLISSDKVISGKLDVSNSSVTANVNEGIARTYSNTDFVIETSDDNSKINLRFGDNIGGDNIQLRPTRNDQVLVLGESRAAAMAFTNQGAELVELSMDALHRREAEEDMQVFASAYGNASEYETGSHVKVNGYSSIVGIGKKNDSGLSYGAFFENGTGNYSTHNVTDGEYMRGDGEATYNGGGIFVRKDNPNGVYVEGAFRAGNLSNKLERAVRNGDHLTGYDINTLYYGAQLGVGKIIPVGKNSLDVYGKFLYTHHDSERFDIEGTDMYFDSVTSQRLRLGARMNHEQNAKLNLYYGAAWEYEFDGDAQDKVDEFDLDTPSLEGSTVIGELGLNYRANDKWTVDLNFRGYGGQRDGYSGSVHVNCAF